MKKVILKSFQFIFRNNDEHPILFWLFQQSPEWFKVNIVWRLADFKYELKNLIVDLLPIYEKEWQYGYLSCIDDNGIWITWNDDETFIPNNHKKWIKYFSNMIVGDEFRCHFWWSPRSYSMIRIKDVEKIESTKKEG